jgi:hypothetical protein
VEPTEDEARPGRPFSVRNEGLIAKVRERIQEERCATVRMMADEFGVNRETIRQILVEDLGKRQLVSSSQQCTGSPGSCCTIIFSPKTSVRAQTYALLP